MNKRSSFLFIWIIFLRKLHFVLFNFPERKRSSLIYSLFLSLWLSLSPSDSLSLPLSLLLSLWLSFSLSEENLSLFLSEKSSPDERGCVENLSFPRNLEHPTDPRREGVFPCAVRVSVSQSWTPAAAGVLLASPTPTPTPTWWRAARNWVRNSSSSQFVVLPRGELKQVGTSFSRHPNVHLHCLIINKGGQNEVSLLTGKAKTGRFKVWNLGKATPQLPSSCARRGRIWLGALTQVRRFESWKSLKLEVASALLASHWKVHTCTKASSPLFIFRKRVL